MNIEEHEPLIFPTAVQQFASWTSVENARELPVENESET